MTHEPTPAPDVRQLPDGRGAGLALVITSAIAVLAMAHHPVVGGGSASDALTQIERLAGLAAMVHGTMIVILGVWIFAFWVLAERLGLHRGPVRAGLVAYVIGSGAMIGAALVSGFLVPGFAHHGIGSSPERAETVLTLVTFGAHLNQALAQLGVVGMSGGIVGWSIALVRVAGFNRVIGGAGLLIGLIPAAVLLTGHLTLDVHGMGAVVLVEVIWGMAVAAQLIRRRI